MSDPGSRCPRCDQTDVGQTGEYPCPVCGLPQRWDDLFTVTLPDEMIRKGAGRKPTDRGQMDVENREKSSG